VFPKPPPPLPKNHSFSRLSTFSEICERRYAYDCLRPQKPSTALARSWARGSQVHATIEHLCKRWFELKDWGEVYNEYNDDVTPFIEGPLDPQQMWGYMARLRPYLEQTTPLEVEKRFCEIDGLPVVGKIDLISATIPLVDAYRGVPSGGSVKGLCVIDWKTLGAGKKGKSNYEAHESLQLQLYSLASEIPTAAFVYLPMNAKVYSAQAQFTPEELARIKRWLETQDKTIRCRWEDYDNIGFDAFSLASRECFLCTEKWCQHWNECPAGAPRKDQ